MSDESETSDDDEEEDLDDEDLLLVASGDADAFGLSMSMSLTSPESSLLDVYGEFAHHTPRGSGTGTSYTGNAELDAALDGMQANVSEYSLGKPLSALTGNYLPKS